MSDDRRVLLWALRQQTTRGDLPPGQPQGAPDSLEFSRNVAWSMLRGMTPAKASSALAALQREFEDQGVPLSEGSPASDGGSEGEPAPAFTKAVAAGFLLKRRDVMRTWRPRFFILDGRYLHYYERRDLARPFEAGGSEGASAEDRRFVFPTPRASIYLLPGTIITPLDAEDSAKSPALAATKMSKRDEELAAADPAVGYDGELFAVGPDAFTPGPKRRASPGSVRSGVTGSVAGGLAPSPRSPDGVQQQGSGGGNSTSGRGLSGESTAYALLGSRVGTGFYPFEIRHPSQRTAYRFAATGSVRERDAWVQLLRAAAAPSSSSSAVLSMLPFLTSNSNGGGGFSPYGSGGSVNGLATPSRQPPRSYSSLTAASDTAAAASTTPSDIRILRLADVVALHTGGEVGAGAGSAPATNSSLASTRGGVSSSVSLSSGSGLQSPLTSVVRAAAPARLPSLPEPVVSEAAAEAAEAPAPAPEALAPPQRDVSAFAAAPSAPLPPPVTYVRSELPPEPYATLVSEGLKQLRALADVTAPGCSLEGIPPPPGTLTSDGAWKFAETKGGVRCWVANDGSPAARGDGFIPFPRSVLFDQVVDINKKGETDSQFAKGHVIVSWGSHSTITYMRFKGMLVVSGRDFVNLTHWCVEPDGTLLVLAKSVTHPDGPEVSGFVRGQCHIGGWVIRPRPGLAAAAGGVSAPRPHADLAIDADGCYCTYLMRSDFKGSIPSSVTAKVAAQQAMLVGKMREFLVGKYSGPGASPAAKAHVAVLRSKALVNVTETAALEARAAAVAAAAAAASAPAPADAVAPPLPASGLARRRSSVARVAAVLPAAEAPPAPPAVEAAPPATAPATAPAAAPAAPAATEPAPAALVAAPAHGKTLARALIFDAPAFAALGLAGALWFLLARDASASYLDALTAALAEAAVSLSKPLSSRDPVAWSEELRALALQECISNNAGVDALDASTQACLQQQMAAARADATAAVTPDPQLVTFAVLGVQPPLSDVAAFFSYFARWALLAIVQSLPPSMLPALAPAAATVATAALYGFALPLFMSQRYQ